MQRSTFTSQNPGPEGDGRNLQFTLHRPKPQPQKTVSSQPAFQTKIKTQPHKTMSSRPGFLNKNQNPTLHFRPVNRAVSAGEVFLCALRPPATKRARPAAPPPYKQPTARGQGGSPSPRLATVPPPSMQLARPGRRGQLRLPLAASPQHLQPAGKHRGGRAAYAQKQVAQRVVPTEVRQGSPLRPHPPVSPWGP